MIDHDELTERVAGMLAALNVEADSIDADLIASGLMDSLVLVEFLTQLEDQMGVVVPVEELNPEHFRSIRSIAAFIVAQRTPLRFEARGSSTT